MPQYLSPGVYVEEVPSAVKPIAGVGTSTACFIGLVPDAIQIPRENPKYDPTGRSGEPLPAVLDEFKFLGTADELRGKVDAAQKALNDNKDDSKKSDLMKAVADAKKVAESSMAADDEPVLCTNFSDFTKSFGGFSTDPGQNQLAHAVYGFFNNGGTRCYVVRYRDAGRLGAPDALMHLEAIDEIAIVAAPGITDKATQDKIVTHCTNMKDRFAILDVPQTPAGLTEKDINSVPVDRSDYAAIYFPWIEVFDVAKKIQNPTGDGMITVPPSGHVAGIYARVDNERGVHKAPANEVVRGALDVDHQISKGVQDGLNPHGVNCIRYLNNQIVVWGARTVGGDANSDLKYINVRRTLLFLRKSIDEGTQWVVFEPNDRTLWAKIVRNVAAFLTTVWRSGALFGSSPAEAFYVKCDDETNPPEERELGRVTTEIGVAIVRPAEFVIFRISQWGGPQAK
jgi:phage tail sheath protein FI